MMRKLRAPAIIAGLFLCGAAVPGQEQQGIVDPARPPYNARFDGVTDDTAALNAAFSAAAGGRGSLVRLRAGAVTKVNGNLTLDIAKVHLDCEGATIDASGAKSGATFTLTTSSHSPNQMGGIHYAHPIENCLLSGPAPDAGVDAFHFQPVMIGNTPWITGILLERVSGTGYRNFLQTGPGTVALTIQNGSFGGDQRPSGTFWDVIGGVNTGENFRAVNFFVANANACFNDHGSNASNVDIFAVNFSCDGVHYILTGGQRPGAGSSFLTLFYSGHIEDILASDYAINVSNGGFDFLSGEWIGTQKGGQSHSLCKVEGAFSGAEIGIRLGQVQFNDSTGTFIPFGNNRLWCEGSGPFRVTSAAALGNTTVGLFARSNNLIANGDDPSPADFNISGMVATDRTVKPAGASSSLHLSAAAGASIAATSRPCSPGTIAAVAAEVRTAGLAAGHGSAAIQIGYLSAGGRVLVSNQIELKEDLPAFSYRQLVPAQLRAPAGTASCRALFEVAAPAGALHMWVAHPQFILQ